MAFTVPQALDSGSLLSWTHEGDSDGWLDIKELRSLNIHCDGEKLFLKHNIELYSFSEVSY